jgi:4-hydroxy-tetrahydrodipicolinate reductase
MKNILVFGSKGRMGKAIIEELNLIENIKTYGIDEGEIYPSANIDLIIDFSTKEAVWEHLKFAFENNIPFLTGITGFSEEELLKIKAYSEYFPLLIDYNMSIGINTIVSLLKTIKNKLKNYDIEIIETHHKHKKDSPSGTAKKLFNELNNQKEFKEINGRNGESPRTKNEIGIHSVRGGGIFGEHIIRFIGEYEEVAISHKALSRKTFAKGAVDAALWLINQEKGFYNMSDFLNKGIYE